VRNPGTKCALFIQLTELENEYMADPLVGTKNHNVGWYASSC